MAGPFPNDFVESVRDAGDIVRLVSDYVPLKQAGSRLKGLCPFHEEKTPSFSVDPSRQLFFCFGCQTGGDIFKFVMLYEKVGFGEAIEILAKRWGLPLPAPTGRTRVDDGRDRLLKLNETAVAFYRAALADPEAGRSCREYIRRRGLDDEVVAGLGLGYAPGGWESLRSHLLAKRFRPDELLKAGLVLERKSGSGQYDRFRDRLVFPIRSLDGRTVAFGGRTLGSDDPKYINSPETPLYKKGEHLYGLDLARDSIRRRGFVIVVEGYLDLAAVVQAGVENVVASLGTAFTESQAKLLARHSDKVVFSYDGDTAGASATARSLDLLLTRGFDVRVVELPAGCDPDDFIRKHGSEAYGRLLETAPTYLDFLIRRETRTRDLTRIDDKVAAINAVLPHLARLKQAVERAEWAGRLADALQVDDALVMQELRSAVKSSRPSIKQRPASARRIRPAEIRLITELLRSEAERRRWSDELDLSDLEGTEVRPIVETIIRLTHDDQPVDYAAVRDSLAEETDRDLITEIAFRDEPEDGPTVEDCLCAFRRQRLVREGREVRREIGSLQQQGAPGASGGDVDQYLKRLEELARQRDALS